jgi:hypothetical protein
MTKLLATIGMLLVASSTWCGAQVLDLGMNNYNRSVRIDTADAIYFLNWMQVSAQKATNTIDSEAKSKFTVTFYEKKLQFGDSTLVDDKTRYVKKWIIAITTQ